MFYLTDIMIQTILIPLLSQKKFTYVTSRLSPKWVCNSNFLNFTEGSYFLNNMDKNYCNQVNYILLICEKNNTSTFKICRLCSLALKATTNCSCTATTKDVTYTRACHSGWKNSGHNVPSRH